MSYPYKPASLSTILLNADTEDLDVLVDYITDSGKGRISLDNEICAKLVKAKDNVDYGVDARKLIESELRRFGGNTVANLLRDVKSLVGGFGPLFGSAPDTAENAVAYDEIVRDVAKHLKVKFDTYAGTPEVEDGILKSLLIASFEKMTAAEREQVLKDLDIPDAAALAARGATAVGAGILAATLTSAMAYQLSSIVAMSTMRALLGRTLTMSAASIVARPITILAGPIGWAVTGAWALADMASPAYRVTVPCVVQIAYMRNKARMQALPGTP